MLEEIQKDITTAGKFSVIAHGVNCQHVMGSGVAQAIKTKWPVIYKDYMNSPCVLGASRFIEVEPDVWVANCYTQFYYGRDKNRKYADPLAVYTSVRSSLAHVSVLSKEGKEFSLYVPQIGCGLGGLSYEKDVLPILERLAWEFPKRKIFVCTI